MSPLPFTAELSNLVRARAEVRFLLGDRLTMSQYILTTSCVRRVYLITYAQANIEKFPTRASFAEAIKDAFSDAPGSVQVVHYACCMEQHADEGAHYHCCVKRSGGRQWLAVKNLMQERHRVVVHFSSRHENYNTTYKYVLKEDGLVHHSEGHPDLSQILNENKTAAINRTSRKSTVLTTTTSTDTAGHVTRSSTETVTETCDETVPST